MQNIKKALVFNGAFQKQGLNNFLEASSEISLSFLPVPGQGTRTTDISSRDTVLSFFHMKITAEA